MLRFFVSSFFLSVEKIKLLISRGINDANLLDNLMEND